MNFEILNFELAWGLGKRYAVFCSTCMQQTPEPRDKVHVRGNCNCSMIWTPGYNHSPHVNMKTNMYLSDLNLLTIGQVIDMYGQWKQCCYNTVDLESESEPGILLQYSLWIRSLCVRSGVFSFSVQFSPSIMQSVYCVTFGNIVFYLLTFRVRELTVKWHLYYLFRMY